MYLLRCLLATAVHLISSLLPVCLPPVLIHPAVLVLGGVYVTMCCFLTWVLGFLCTGSLKYLCSCPLSASNCPSLRLCGHGIDLLIGT